MTDGRSFLIDGVYVPPHLARAMIQSGGAVAGRAPPRRHPSASGAVGVAAGVRGEGGRPAAPGAAARGGAVVVGGGGGPAAGMLAGVGAQVGAGGADSGPSPRPGVADRGGRDGNNRLEGDGDAGLDERNRRTGGAG
jgi:hypothetical protein